MKIIKGKITGQGPIKTEAGAHGEDIVFLRPEDLPIMVYVDGDSLHDNWVRVINPHFDMLGPIAVPDGAIGWVELPRFTPDAPEPIPPADTSIVIVDWIARTITIKPE